MEWEMITRPCPLCGLPNDSNALVETNLDVGRLDDFAFAARKVPEYMHYRLISCPVCDLLYANPLPRPGTLAKAYQEAAFDSSEEAYYASCTYGRFVREIIKKLPDLVGAIDIGTGNGAFLEQLLAKGFTDVIGVEPSKAPVAAAKDEIRPLIRHSLFQPRDFENCSFSLVTCFQTLEHLYDPMGMCRNAYKMLKKAGAVFLICHNRRSLSTKLLGFKSPIFDIEHLQLFSPRSVRYLLEQSGFVDVEVKVIYNCYPLHYWLKLIPLPRKLKLVCMSVLKKTGIGYIPISIPAGNMAVIGYKKVL